MDNSSRKPLSDHLYRDAIIYLPLLFLKNKKEKNAKKNERNLLVRMVEDHLKS